MSKRTKSLAQWCEENNKNHIIDELDMEKNNLHYASGYIPERIEYNSPSKICWKCNKGHEWRSEIVGRTLFDLKCPVCFPSGNILPVGTKYGCLTIIDGFDAYQEEVAAKEIARFQKEKEDFLNGIRPEFSNVDSADFYDDWISDYKNRKFYKCQCKCGKIHYYSQSGFLESRHRYCTERMSTTDFLRLSENDRESYLLNLCGLAAEAEKKKFKECKRVLARNYDEDYSGRFFESLEVLECVDNQFERLTSYGDLRKKGSATFTVYKAYRCRCYLCGKEKKVLCTQFHIDPPTAYGYTAYNGYWSGVECGCHKVSSFQWIVNKLLLENGVPYKVEVEFSDLYGISNEYRLRYDFAVCNPDGSIRALIECQGEQHFMPIKEFGGATQFEKQKKNDTLKREYAIQHNIPLVELSYKKKKIEDIRTILEEKNIL